MSVLNGMAVKYQSKKFNKIGPWDEFSTLEDAACITCAYHALLTCTFSQKGWANRIGPWPSVPEGVVCAGGKVLKKVKANFWQ